MVIVVLLLRIVETNRLTHISVLITVLSLSELCTLIKGRVVATAQVGPCLQGVGKVQEPCLGVNLLLGFLGIGAKGVAGYVFCNLGRADGACLGIDLIVNGTDGYLYTTLVERIGILVDPFLYGGLCLQEADFGATDQHTGCLGQYILGGYAAAYGLVVIV